MLFAGLTGFFNADAENRKANREATRAAQAKLLEGQRGFKRQMILDSIESTRGDLSAVQKLAAKDEVTLSDAYRTSTQAYNDYVTKYEVGKPFNPPSIDFASLNYVNDDFNFIFKDDGGNKLKFKADVFKGGIADFRSYMAEVDGKYLASKKNNQNYFKGISDENLGTMYSYYMSGLSALRAAERKEQGEGFEGTNFLPENEFTRNLHTPFYGGTALANELISRGKKTKQDVENDVNSTVLNSKPKLNGETMTGGSVKLPDNKVVSTTFAIPKEFDGAADVLATAMNTTKGNLYNDFANKFYNLPNIKPEKVEQVFKASLYFAKNITNIGQLSPNKATSYGTAESIAEMDQVINDSNLSFNEVVFAFAPYMDVSAHIAQKLPTGAMIGKIQKPMDESTQSYAGRGFAGRTADKAEREKAFIEARNNFQQQQKVQIALTGFLGERLALFKSEGKGVRTEFVAGFVSKLRALKEVALDFGSAVFENGKLNIDKGKLQVTSGVDDDNTGENDKTLTEGYLTSLKERAMRDALAYSSGNQLDEKVARLQAMRITLAFQMARAADPSGRLSNQDIEQQFVKLAGNFGTEKAALAGIQVAIDEFKGKAEVNKQIFDFVKDGDASRIETFKTIDALFVVNDIQRKAKTARLLGAAKPSAAKSTTGVDMSKKRPDGSDLYIDMGTHAIETQGFTAINKETGKIIPPDELKSFIESKGSETANP